MKNLRGKKVEGESLTDETVQLGSSTLQSCVLSRTRFNLDIHSSCLSECEADQTEFVCSDRELRTLILDQSNFAHASFCGLYLSVKAAGSNFERSDFRHAVIKDSDLTGCNFNGADLTGACFIDSDLSGASFSGVNLKWTSFIRCKIPTTGTYARKNNVRLIDTVLPEDGGAVPPPEAMHINVAPFDGLRFLGKQNTAYEATVPFFHGDDPAPLYHLTLWRNGPRNWRMYIGHLERVDGELLGTHFQRFGVGADIFHTLWLATRWLWLKGDLKPDFEQMELKAKAKRQDLKQSTIECWQEVLRLSGPAYRFSPEEKRQIFERRLRYESGNGIFPNEWNYHYEEIDTLDFTGSNLSGAVIKDILMPSMPESSLAEVSLSKVDMTGGDYRSSNFHNAFFWGATLDGADLSDTDLRKVRFIKTPFSGVNLSGADLRDATFEKSPLENILYDQHTRWPVEFEPPPSLSVEEWQEWLETDEPEPSLLEVFHGFSKLTMDDQVFGLIRDERRIIAWTQAGREPAAWYRGEELDKALTLFEQASPEDPPMVHFLQVVWLLGHEQNSAGLLDEWSDLIGWELGPDSLIAGPNGVPKLRAALLEALDENVECWNDRVQQHSQLSFNEYDFDNMVAPGILGMDAESSSFAGADLAGARFSGCSLGDCIFDAANLAGAAFSGCQLRYSSFANSNLTKASFRSADLRDCDFSHATLHRVDFTGATLHGADLSTASLRDCIFAESTIDEETLFPEEFDCSEIVGDSPATVRLIEERISEFNADLPDQRLVQVAPEKAELADAALADLTLVLNFNVEFKNCVLDNLEISIPHWAGFTQSTLRACHVRGAGYGYKECKVEDLRLESAALAPDPSGFYNQAIWFQNCQVGTLTHVSSDTLELTIVGSTVSLMQAEGKSLKLRLRKSVLAGNFKEAEIVCSDFYEVDVSGCDFTGATFVESRFHTVKVDGAVFQDTVFFKVNFDGDVRGESAFEGAEFIDCHFGFRREPPITESYGGIMSVRVGTSLLLEFKEKNGTLRQIEILNRKCILEHLPDQTTHTWPILLAEEHQFAAVVANRMANCQWEPDGIRVYVREETETSYLIAARMEQVWIATWTALQDRLSSTMSE